MVSDLGLQKRAGLFMAFAHGVPYSLGIVQPLELRAASPAIAAELRVLVEDLELCDSNALWLESLVSHLSLALASDLFEELRCVKEYLLNYPLSPAALSDDEPSSPSTFALPPPALSLGAEDYEELLVGDVDPSGALASVKRRKL